ncbi:MAG: ATP-binding cassette domain-containing protein [Methylococcaceae bacterium]
MTTLLIEAKNLSRYYGKHCAVDNVSFSLSKGEVLGFLGPNGAGKTTTMQMLCGNLAPSTGQISINSYDLLEQPKQAKKYLGYLPDTPPLYKELTVNEFLEYCARLHRVPFRETSHAVNTAKSRCGLTDVADRLIINLSKGYQQRIGIAQAILHNPEIIILDEPTVGLDPIQIREIRSLIKELGTDHGVILSTHILPEVQASCTHVQIINQGKLILKETINGLNQRMNTTTIKVVTRVPIEIDLFLAISSISSVEKTGNTSYLMHHDQNNNPIEQIAEIIVNSGWGIQELTPIKKSMEDIFIKLTTEQTGSIKKDIN